MEIETCAHCKRLLFAEDVRWPVWDDRPHCELCARRHTADDGSPLVLEVVRG